MQWSSLSDDENRHLVGRWKEGYWIASCFGSYLALSGI
jgi:hypothetical protein